MKNTSFRMLTVAVIATIASGLVCSAVFAADDNSNLAMVSLELKDVDLRSAIESLFRGTGKNYAIEADVTGIVPSMSIRDVSFDVALKSLTKTSGLVYRIDNDIYMISKKPEIVNATSTDATAQALADAATVDATTTVETIIDKIQLTYTSPAELLSIMSGSNSGNGNGNGYGGMTGMMGMGGTSGMNSMNGMSGMSGMSGMGNSSYGYGGSSSGYGSSYNTGSSYGRSW
ncbi:MAG: STN domain-containing protein [Armatimonadota bacterium]